MTAWAKLLAASSLSSGSAWQLLSAPKTGGTGLVVNDGVAVELGETRVDVEVAAMEVEAEVMDVGVEVEIPTAPFEVEVATAPIEVEVQE